MKHLTKKATALALALTLGLAPMAAASEALGKEILGGSLDLSTGTNLSEQIFWSDTFSDLRSERYFTYQPNKDVHPVVTYGEKVLTKATLTDMAKTLEAQGKRVVTGINGDLYGIATGAPLGVVITDGILRSVPGTDNFDARAVGFRGDGSAFIGVPQLTMTATFQGFTFAVGGGMNKIRNAVTNFVLYTEDYSATTQHTEPGIDVILTPVLDNLGTPVTVDLDITKKGQPAPAAEGELAPPDEVKGTLIQSERPAIGGRVTYKVEQVLESTASIPIPPGKAILSCNAKSDAYYTAYIRLLQPGDTVDIDITTPEAPWGEADQAMGGFYKLVTASQVTPGLPTERTAYSAVGVKADGSAIFYTVDGKQPGYSVGATLTQVAMRMLELGCVDAVSLDGGGSTTIGATYPDGTSLGVINKPSDGKQRTNSVALFLTTDLKPTGILTGLYVTPNTGLLLSGAKVPLAMKGLDSSYYTMAVPEPPSWSIPNGDGAVSSDGIFTAGGTNGIAKVTATYNNATGNATMTVVNNPDKIYLADEGTGQAVTSLVIDPNGIVDLKASATYKTLAMTSQDTCYKWSLDPAVGTVDENGVITAGPKTASGNLVVTVAGATITLPVSVAGHVNTLEGFEGGSATMTPSGGVKLTQENGSDRVRYGSHSLRVDYDAALGGTASLVTTLTAAVGEKYLNLWVYGDGSANSLTATFADALGVTNEVILAGLDFTGWKYISVAIPAGASALRSINLIFGGGEKTSGSFWLDQLTTSNEPVQDGTPPVVTISQAGTQLTATAADNMDKKFTAAQVKVTYDGAALTVTFDPATATIKATLPNPDGKLHQAAVMVTDASGNIGRGTVSIDPIPLAAPIFTDTAGHWGELYAIYLYDRKVTSGVTGPVESTILFQPDKAITRGELFSMVARWLGTDLAKYSDTVLPFADAETIPEWALPGVKAMYSLGYLKGSTGADGALYANAANTISRAEAMTILGRVQAGGYAQVDLTFADAEQVPAWAAPYVRTLVGQGVVSGYENRIMPADPVRRSEVARMLFGMS